MTTDVLLADRLTIVRAGVRKVVEDFDGYRVVAETDDGLDAVRVVRERRPRLVILDFGLRGLDGADLITRIGHIDKESRCIVLSADTSAGRVHESLRSGALGYVVKSAPPEELAHALRAASQGRLWVSPAVSAFAAGIEPAPGATAAASQRAPGGLTPRQREILRLIAEGVATRDIAARLGLSAKTVEAHRARITHRLGIYDVAGLTRFAIRAGLISAEA